MNTYFIVKIIHVLSSTILFGTGICIAFFMWRSSFTQDLQQKYFAARTTVLADTLFTFPAVVIQPATGFWMIWKAGYNLTDFWLLLTYALYIIAGCCWLPVVWIQFQLKKQIELSLQQNTPLPARYHRLFRWWFALGWPAFMALIVVFYLMVTKPL